MLREVDTHTYSIDLVLVSDMGMMANVDVLGREIIKPSSPTPHHLRNFKMSFIDQRWPPTSYTSFALFYAFDDTNSSSAEEKSRCLKNSLSQVLTHYYPLAGKIKDHMSVDCNDHGALFIDARVVGCSLTDLLRQPDVRMFRNLVKESPDHLLIIQATSFTSGGGMAIGFSIRHKVADGVAMCSFLKAWSNTTVSTTMAAAVEVDLTSPSSLFPPLDDLDPLVLEEDKPFVFADGIPRRYVFSSSSIENLKTKAVTNDVPKPTRVQVVSSLIWKCRMATAQLQSPTRKPSMLLFLTNLRPILEPPLPEHTLRNIIVGIQTQEGGGGGGDTTTDNLLVAPPPDVSSLVTCIRSSLEELRGDFVAKYQVAGTGGIQAYVKELWSRGLASWAGFDLNVSWCRLPFYQADFGWGRPAWVSGVPGVCVPRETKLIDTRDGNGIEAHVNFATEEEATLFESNQELLQHVELNPCVLL